MQTVFQGIDHHWNENKFATCGEVVEIWDEERSEPVRSVLFGWTQILEVKLIDHRSLCKAIGRTINACDEFTSGKFTFLTYVRSFTWGVDSVHSLRFNPVETHILGSTASDRSIMLYDMRGSTPLRKVRF